MDIIIQEAKSEADIDFIAKHFEETIALWENYEVTEKSIDNKKKSVKEWIKQTNTHITVALTSNGKIIGFNSLWITEGNSGEKCGKICILYIIPEYWGKGVAHKLKVEGEAWLKSQGIKRVITEIDAKNERMLKISKDAGFKIKSFLMEKKFTNGG